MEKKKYMKPSMEVYELDVRAQILNSSPDPYNRDSPDPYDQDFGYMPGVNDDMNKTA